jgi:hypothetical protein
MLTKSSPGARLYQDGSLLAINAEQLISASDLAEAMTQIRELQRSRGKNNGSGNSP